MKPQIQLVIFDCDGVLIDSEVLALKAWQRLLSRQHIRLTSDYFVQHFLGKSMQHVVTKLQQDFSLVFSDTDQQQFHTLLRELFVQHLRPTDGIDTVLSKLTVPFCLATSSSPARTEHALNVTGLTRFFAPNVRFTRDEVKHGKPAPDLFLHAAMQQQVAPAHCLVIEDSPAGLQAAQAASMPFLHYTGASHLTGQSSPSTSLSHWSQLPERYPLLFNSEYHE